MTAPDWKDLERLWQSHAAAAPALRVIRKQRRRKWLSTLVLGSEVVITIAGIAFGAWFIALGTTFGLVAGGGLVVFTLFAAAASLWARRLPSVAMEESVTAALAAALRRARVSVRWGFATFWIVAASLVFYAVISFLWAAGSDYPPALVRRMLVVLGVWMLWSALAQGVAIYYYLSRARELARLEEMARALAADG